MKQKRGKGRPSAFTDKIADTICKRLSEGESLLQICRDPDMPGRNAVYQWLEKHEDFAAKYARARERQAETLADQVHFIAETEEDVNRARLRIDAIKWHAGKLAPRIYGDKLQHSGEGGGPVLIKWAAEDDDA